MTFCFHFHFNYGYEIGYKTELLYIQLNMISERASTMISNDSYDSTTSPQADNENLELHPYQVFPLQEHALEFIDSWSQRNFSPLAKVI